jgi:hypothetical protein
MIWVRKPIVVALKNVSSAIPSNDSVEDDLPQFTIVVRDNLANVIARVRAGYHKPVPSDRWQHTGA